MYTCLLVYLFPCFPVYLLPTRSSSINTSHSTDTQRKRQRYTPGEKECCMNKTVLVELSDALADAAELAGKSTVLVNARRRLPASGIIFASDLVLTAEHVVEKEEDVSVVLADGTEVPAK